MSRKRFKTFLGIAILRAKTLRGLLLDIELKKKALDTFAEYCKTCEDVIYKLKTENHKLNEQLKKYQDTAPTKTT